MTIGIAGAWGMVEVLYQSYEYAAPISGMSYEPELFGPKAPEQYDWKYENRFEYNKYNIFVNC
jgi:hypothetical protein